MSFTVKHGQVRDAAGEQAQVDWGMIAVWIGELRIKVHLFVMVLGFSRRIFVRAYEHEQLSNLLDGHEAAFTRFGGRTRMLLYDNPRTIVLSKDEASGSVEWKRRFKDRMDFYGVEVKLCRNYRAQTNGKVESGVKYVKQNALAGRRFASMDDLNEWLEQWAVTIADQRIHGTTRERPAVGLTSEKESGRRLMAESQWYARTDHSGASACDILPHVAYLSSRLESAPS